jgi:deazaflavin-dependent oxidoreductase (nitroreductase family)
MYGYEQTNWLRRVMRLSGSVRPITWFYARALHHIDHVVYRLTRGRGTFTSWVSGLPIVMLTTTGARSGRRRTLPVLGVPHDGNLVVIASNYGQDHNPAWYYNLRAHPGASIIFEGERRQVVARELSGDERESWYARGVEIYPGWTSYRKRAPRTIPVMELQPLDQSG